jgi:hypothetical protein
VCPTEHLLPRLLLHASSSRQCEAKRLSALFPCASALHADDGHVLHSCCKEGSCFLVPPASAPIFCFPTASMQAPATLASSPVTPAAEIPAASQETARRSTAGAQVLSNPVAPPGTRPCGTATSGLSASQVTGADQVPGVPSKVSNSSEACQDASACDSAARRPAVLCQREVKRPRRETPHNQEQSGKGAEVYRRILTWQGEPERTTLPSEAPAPGQPPL